MHLRLNNEAYTMLSVNLWQYFGELPNSVVKYKEYRPSRPRKDITKRSARNRSIPCRFFNSGKRCRFGNRCWFSHEKKSNRSKPHRARGCRGGKGQRDLGTEVASLAVESLLLKGKVFQAKSVVLELNK